MKNLTYFSHCWVFLTGPGVRFVPEHVWHSKFFWIAVVVMMVTILLYHNRKSKNGRYH